MKIIACIFLCFVVCASSERAGRCQNIQWDSTFLHGNAPNGPVYAIAVVGSKVYAGGKFTRAGSVEANNIAVWDGAVWKSLGKDVLHGVNGIVRAIAFDSVGHLYVGGKFDSAGNVAASNIAMWDGTSWSNLNSGVNDTVYSILVTSPHVYIGGAFTKADTSTAVRFADWTGNHWEVFKNFQPNKSVNTIDYFLNGILVAGQFDSVNRDVLLRYAVTFDGKIFAPDPLRGPVYSSTPCYAGFLIGGDFTYTPGTRNIAWAGGFDYLLPRETSLFFNHPIFALQAISYKACIAGGAFDSVGGTRMAHLCIWNGAKWRTCESNLKGNVYALGVIGKRVFVGTEDPNNTFASFLLRDTILMRYATSASYGAYSSLFSRGTSNVTISNDSTSNAPLDFILMFITQTQHCQQPLNPYSKFSNSIVPGTSQTMSEDIDFRTSCGGWNAGAVLLDNSVNFSQEKYLYVNGDISAVSGAPPNSLFPLVYPNPFYSTINFDFTTVQNERIAISIYDARGMLVKQLANEKFGAGKHIISWNPENLPKAMYMYNIHGLTFQASGKLLFLGKN